MSSTKFPSVSINEKLQKRILRSKINYCHKFLKVERLQSEIETRKSEFDLEDQNFIQLLPIHPPMKFTQEEKHHCQRMNINIPTPLEMQQKLKAQLTHSELLEIGEDPAYFIQDEEMRRLNWNEEDWLSKSHEHFKKEMKDIPKIKSTSNLLKIQKPTFRSNTEDRTERKKKMIDEQVKRLHEVNEGNFQKVKYNQETKEMEKQKDPNKMFKQKNKMQNMKVIKEQLIDQGKNRLAQVQLFRKDIQVKISKINNKLIKKYNFHGKSQLTQSKRTFLYSRFQQILQKLCEQVKPLYDNIFTSVCLIISIKIYLFLQIHVLENLLCQHYINNEFIQITNNGGGRDDQIKLKIEIDMLKQAGEQSNRFESQRQNRESHKMPNQQMITIIFKFLTEFKFKRMEQSKIEYDKS